MLFDRPFVIARSHVLRFLPALPLLCGLGVLCGLAQAPAAQIGLEWQPVGDPGNPPHPTLPTPTNAEGSIPYRFDITKYEITNEQYTAFLNAVGGADTTGLWSPQMGSNALGGIDHEERAVAGGQRR